MRADRWGHGWYLQIPLDEFYIPCRSADASGLAEQFAAFDRSMRWALERFELDGDGMPDFLIGKLEADPNSKVSLWTFDNLSWTFDDGVSACSAGQWVAATRAAERSAGVLRLDAAQERWRAQAARARQSYDEQLWDAAEGRYRLGPARREVFADCLHFFYDAVSKLDAFDTTACGAR